jgi:Ca2+-binding RTX toxin-like protein
MPYGSLSNPASPRGAVPNGGAGDDRLEGSERGERMRGHRGDDLLVGNLGNDTLVGGRGDDIFAFGRHGVYDTIQDFGQVAGDRDRIMIDDPAMTCFADLAIAYSDGDAIFSYATFGQLRQIVIVVGVGDRGLSDADFLFGPFG